MLVAASLFIATIPAVLLPGSVQANGIHAGSREVYSGPVGPYFAKVTTAPYAGTVHFIVYLSRAGGSEVPEGAEIEVSARRPANDFPPVGPVAAVASLDGPNLFTVDIPVEQVGEWVFTVRVAAAQGEGSVEIPLTLVQRGGVNLGFIGVALVVAVVAGLAALSWRRRRHPKRRGTVVGG